MCINHNKQEIFNLISLSLSLSLSLSHTHTHTHTFYENRCGDLSCNKVVCLRNKCIYRKETHTCFVRTGAEILVVIKFFV